KLEATSPPRIEPHVTLQERDAVAEAGRKVEDDFRFAAAGADVGHLYHWQLPARLGIKPDPRAERQADRFRSETLGPEVRQEAVGYRDAWIPRRSAGVGQADRPRSGDGHSLRRQLLGRHWDQHDLVVRGLGRRRQTADANDDRKHADTFHGFLPRVMAIIC